jgi:hypothetical protein
MDKNKYMELSSFFSSNKWKNMPEYDRKRNYNILENYKLLQSLGKFLSYERLNTFIHTACLLYLLHTLIKNELMLDHPSSHL